MDDIVDKWKSFSLTASEDKEVDVCANGKDSLFSSADINLCLVAKVFSSKKTNSDAFRSVKKSAWKAHDNTRIELAGDNIFVVKFRSIMEKSSVISNGPWTFDHALVVLRSPKESENLSTLSFTEVAFWVQVHNVPFNCMNSVMAQRLGEVIGKVEEIENSGMNDWTGPFMRIRVIIDITKPLRRGLKVKNSEGLIVWCPILYEKLPDICFGCGLIGHSFR